MDLRRPGFLVSRGGDVLRLLRFDAPTGRQEREIDTCCAGVRKRDGVQLPTAMTQSSLTREKYYTIQLSVRKRTV